MAKIVGSKGNEPRLDDGWAPESLPPQRYSGGAFIAGLKDKGIWVGWRERGHVIDKDLHDRGGERYRTTTSPCFGLPVCELAF